MTCAKCDSPRLYTVKTWRAGPWFYMLKFCRDCGMENRTRYPCLEDAAPAGRANAGELRPPNA